MIEGLIGPLVFQTLLGALSLAGVSGSLIADAGIPSSSAGLLEQPVAIVGTVLDSPAAGTELYAAGGVPGVDTYAALLTGSYEEPIVIEAGASVPLLPAGSSTSLVGSPVGGVVDTAMSSLGSVLQSLPLISGLLVSL